MFIYFLFLITLFVGTGIHSSDTQITLQFNDQDKTTEKYPLKDVQLFKFIKNMVEDTAFNANEIVPLLISKKTFDILLKLRAYLETQEDPESNTSNLIAKFKNDANNVYAAIMLCKDAYYLTSSDFAEKANAQQPSPSQKAVPLLVEIFIRILLDYLKSDKDLPDKSVLDEIPRDLQKIIAGMLLGDMILDDSLDTDNWHVRLTDHIQAVLSPYASDKRILRFGTRNHNWIDFINKTNDIREYMHQGVYLPHHENFSYMSEYFGVTPDDKYSYVTSWSNKKDQLILSIYNNATEEFKDKIIERDLLSNVFASTLDDTSTGSSKLTIEICQILYDPKTSVFSIIFLLSSEKDDYFSLGIASCNIDSKVDLYINRTVFKEFLERLAVPPKTNMTTVLIEYLDLINWNYIDNYLVGISDFKKPGLLYAMPQKQQSSNLSILIYDENTKKWSSSGQATPHFISLSYPRDLSKNIKTMTTSAHTDSFIPSYEKILNQAVQRFYTTLQKENNLKFLKDAKPQVFDAASLRYVTKGSSEIYVYNLIKPALRNVIEVMSDNEEMQTIANAWYVYQASKNSKQYKNLDTDWFTEFRTPAEIQKQYPLPGGGIRTASTLVKPKTSKLLQGYLKPIDFQATKKASATVSAYATLSKLKKTMPEKTLSFLKPKRVKAQATVLPPVDVGLNLPPVKLEPIRETVTVQPAPKIEKPQKPATTSSKAIETEEITSPSNEGFIQKTVKKIKEYLSYFKFW